jgi:hypothetical protein
MKLKPEQIDHARKLIDKGETRSIRGRSSERGPLDTLPGARLKRGCREPLCLQVTDFIGLKQGWQQDIFPE